MTEPKDTVPASKESSGKFWMMLPVLLLGASVLGWVVMIRIAGREPGAVEPNYYAKASHFDEEKLRREVSGRLGWALETVSFDLEEGKGTLVVSLLDRDGKPVLGAHFRAEAFQNAGADRTQSVAFEEVKPGQYAGSVLRPRLGIWEFRVSASQGESEFVTVLRPELGSGT